MKLSPFILLALLISALCRAGFAQTSLVVTINNIKNKEGTMRIAVFNNEEDFLKKAFAGKSVKVDASEIVVTFEDLPPGKYALSLFHDENENGELDLNFIGVPKEGFGFGNNAMGFFGPPSFEKAKFTVGSETEHHVITLRFL